MTFGRTDAGVTLLELVAVLAIFSVLSLMGIQLLSQAMTNRDAVATTDARVAALSTAVAVLRRDLEQAMPQPGASGDRPAFAITGHELQVVTGDTADLVLWQVDADTGRLRRTVSGEGAVSVNLDNVTAMRIHTLGAAGWIDGAAWRPEGPADLPQGIRVVLTLADLGDVPIVVAR